MATEFPAFVPAFTELRMTQPQYDTLMSYIRNLEKTAAGNVAVLHTGTYGLRWFTFVGDDKSFDVLREMQQQRDQSEKLCAKYRDENELLKIENAQLKDRRSFLAKFFRK